MWNYLELDNFNVQVIVELCGFMWNNIPLHHLGEDVNTGTSFRMFFIYKFSELQHVLVHSNYGSHLAAIGASEHESELFEGIPRFRRRGKYCCRSRTTGIPTVVWIHTNSY